MTTEKTQKTAAERQAKRRKEMEEKGYKNLSLGFVKIDYHDTLKKLAIDIDKGGYSTDLKTKTIVDTSEHEKLKRRITELEGAIKSTKHDLRIQIARSEKQAVEVANLQANLNRYKQVLGRLYWRE